MAQVVWSPSALADVDAIAEYIARDSVDQAALFTTRLYEATDLLQDHPLAGRVIPERGAGGWGSEAEACDLSGGEAARIESNCLDYPPRVAPHAFPVYRTGLWPCGRRRPGVRSPGLDPGIGTVENEEGGVRPAGGRFGEVSHAQDEWIEKIEFDHSAQGADH